LKKGIFNAPGKKIFPNINIKYCIWQYKIALDFFLKRKKKELRYNEVKYNNVCIFYKVISNFPFVNLEYIIDIYM